MIRAAIAFALLLGVLIVLADSRNLGPIGLVYEVRYGDKIGHVVMYGILSLLMNLAVFQHTGRNSARSVLFVTTAVAVVATLEEITQLMFPARRPDFNDVLASCLGITWFGCVALFIAEWRNLAERTAFKSQTD